MAEAEEEEVEKMVVKRVKETILNLVVRVLRRCWLGEADEGRRRLTKI